MEGDDEEQLAATAISGILTSVMLRAADGPEARTWLYIWERDGLEWLIRFKQRRPDGRLCNDWMPAFLELNMDAIPAMNLKPINFNLRAARLAKEDLAGGSKGEAR